MGGHEGGLHPASSLCPIDKKAHPQRRVLVCRLGARYRHGGQGRPEDLPGRAGGAPPSSPTRRKSLERRVEELQVLIDEGEARRHQLLNEDVEELMGVNEAPQSDDEAFDE